MSPLATWSTSLLIAKEPHELEVAIQAYRGAKERLRLAKEELEFAQAEVDRMGDRLCDAALDSMTRGA